MITPATEKIALFKEIIHYPLAVLVLALLAGYASYARAGQAGIIAINIALEPDAKTAAQVKAANARLLAEYPGGFTLDETHHPHITLMQRYVSVACLDGIYETVGGIISNEKIADRKLKITKYSLVPWNNQYLASMLIDAPNEIFKLQHKLIGSLSACAVPTGQSSAFVTTPGEAQINPATIEYVSAFVPEQTGKNYKPHITFGILPQNDLKEVQKNAIDASPFSPAGVGVYQLGNNGTARKKLKEWRFTP